jgi:hypothetical protein
LEPGYLSQYNVWLWTSLPGDRGSIPGRGERIFPLASLSRPALGPTQSPVQWIPGVLSPGLRRGQGVTLTTHPHLAPRSRLSRSYTSSPPSASVACSGTAFAFSQVEGLQSKNYNQNIITALRPMYFLLYVIYLNQRCSFKILFKLIVCIYLWNKTVNLICEDYPNFFLRVFWTSRNLYSDWRVLIKYGRVPHWFIVHNGDLFHKVDSCNVRRPDTG